MLLAFILPYHEDGAGRTAQVNADPLFVNSWTYRWQWSASISVTVTDKTSGSIINTRGTDLVREAEFLKEDRDLDPVWGCSSICDEVSGLNKSFNPGSSYTSGCQTW